MFNSFGDLNIYFSILIFSEEKTQMLSFANIQRVIKEVYFDHWSLSFVVLEREPEPYEDLAKAVPLTERPSCG